jgi:hypothetical protein
MRSRSSIQSSADWRACSAPNNLYTARIVARKSDKIVRHKRGLEIFADRLLKALIVLVQHLGHAVELLNVPFVRFGGMGVEVNFVCQRLVEIGSQFSLRVLYLDLILAIDQHHAKT